MERFNLSKQIPSNYYIYYTDNDVRCYSFLGKLSKVIDGKIIPCSKYVTLNGESVFSVHKDFKEDAKEVFFECHDIDPSRTINYTYLNNKSESDFPMLILKAIDNADSVKERIRLFKSIQKKINKYYL